MKSTILFVGSLQGKKPSSDGQTVKTSNVLRALRESFEGYRIKTINTNRGFVGKLLCAFEAFFVGFFSKKIVFALCQNGLKHVFPALFFGRFLLKKEIHYVVIGGWLPNLLSQNSILKNKLLKIKGIYVETETMVSKMVSLGFTNVFLLPNFKYYETADPLNIKTLDHKKNYSICTFSRVSYEKGIKHAIEAVNKVNDETSFNIQLHIYGKIDDGQQDWFETLMRNQKHSKYMGIIDSSLCLGVIHAYDAIVFPTFYGGEGFAGTILDAFFAHTPIIASNWKYNSEIIIDHENGLLCEPQNSDSLASLIIELFSNNSLYNRISHNEFLEAEKYHPNNAISALISNL